MTGHSELPICDDGRGLHFPEFGEPSEFHSMGWYVWDGYAWSSDRWDWRAILGHPARFMADFKDTIAECCRQNWVHEKWQFFAMGVDYQYTQAICTGVDVKGNGLNAPEDIPNVTCRGALKQHVSFPALDIGARISGFWHGHFSFCGAA